MKVSYNYILKYLPTYIILIFIATSCAIYEPVQIQVLKPAGTKINPKISRLILVNHANYKKKDTELTQNNDSTRTNEYFSGLSGILGNSPRLELVQSPVYYFEKPSFSQRFMKLDWETVSKVCRDSSADAAIVLENYQITYSDPLQLHYSEDYGLYARLMMENTSLWRIYYPSEQLIADEYLQKDTLYWDATGITEADIANQLPDIDEAILQSCWYAGQKFGERISPSWVAKKRYLINCEITDFQNAVLYAQQNNWDNAIEIWKKYPYGKKRRLAAFAAYNLAVASETLDHLDIALEWASKSYLIRKNEYVKKYIELLEKRKKDQEDYIKSLNENP